jgi:hypothetical protein
MHSQNNKLTLLRRNFFAISSSAYVRTKWRQNSNKVLFVHFRSQLHPRPDKKRMLQQLLEPVWRNNIGDIKMMSTAVVSGTWWCVTFLCIFSILAVLSQGDMYETRSQHWMRHQLRAKIDPRPAATKLHDLSIRKKRSQFMAENADVQSRTAQGNL